MIAAFIVIDIHLEGCSSLKEKRRRLGGIRDRIGKRTNVAVCESDYQDAHHISQWSFIAIASNKKVAEQTLLEIEKEVELIVDGYISIANHGVL